MTSLNDLSLTKALIRRVCSFILRTRKKWKCVVTAVVLWPLTKLGGHICPARNRTFKTPCSLRSLLVAARVAAYAIPDMHVIMTSTRVLYNALRWVEEVVQIKLKSKFSVALSILGTTVNRYMFCLFKNLFLLTVLLIFVDFLRSLFFKETEDCRWQRGASTHKRHTVIPGWGAALRIEHSWGELRCLRQRTHSIGDMDWSLWRQAAVSS